MDEIAWKWEGKQWHHKLMSFSIKVKIFLMALSINNNHGLTSSMFYESIYMYILQLAKHKIKA